MPPGQLSTFIEASRAEDFQDHIITEVFPSVRVYCSHQTMLLDSGGGWLLSTTLDGHGGISNSKLHLWSEDTI